MSKYAQVYTNDPVRKVITLTLTFPVEKFADIRPTLVRLSGSAGTVIKKTVSVMPTEKTPFKITGSKAQQGQDIRFEVKEITDPETERAGYLVEVENTTTKPGAFRDVIYLDTDSKDQPQLSIRVYGNLYDRKRIENNQQRPVKKTAPEAAPAPNEDVSM